MELYMYRTVLTTVALALSLSVIGLTNRPASAQMMAKAQVANLIAKVENGVDEFRNYLEKAGRQRARRLVHDPGVRAQKATGHRESEGQRQQQEGRPG
jgi:hypothetical protein